MIYLMRFKRSVLILITHQAVFVILAESPWLEALRGGGYGTGHVNMELITAIKNTLYTQSRFGAFNFQQKLRTGQLTNYFCSEKGLCNLQDKFGSRIADLFSFFSDGTVHSIYCIYYSFRLSFMLCWCELVSHCHQKYSILNIFKERVYVQN